MPMVREEFVIRCEAILRGISGGGGGGLGDWVLRKY